MEEQLFSRDKRRLVPCAECETPVAEVQDDVLIIKSRHHGDRHLTVIPLRWLDKAERKASE